MILAKIKCIINIVAKLLETGLSNSSSFSTCPEIGIVQAMSSPPLVQHPTDTNVCWTSIYGNPAYPTPFQIIYI